MLTQGCCNGQAYDKDSRFCCGGLVGETATEVKQCVVSIMVLLFTGEQCTLYYLSFPDKSKFIGFLKRKIQFLFLFVKQSFSKQYNEFFMLFHLFFIS